MYHCAWSKGVFLSLRTWLQWWHEDLNISLAICFTFAKSKAAWGGNETPKLKIKCAQLWSELITPGQWHIVQPAEMMMQWWHEDLDISLAIYFTFAKCKAAWGGNETAYDKMCPHYGPTPGQWQIIQPAEMKFNSFPGMRRGKRRLQWWTGLTFRRHPGVTCV